MRCICYDRDFEPAEEWMRTLKFPVCTDCDQAIQENWEAYYRYVEAIRGVMAAPASEREEGGKG